MLSFKEYRDLQEQLQGRTLGLTNPANMGLSGLGRWNEAGLEALKKLAAGDMGDELPVKNKKPCPEDAPEDADFEDEDDEEEEEPAPKKFGIFGKTKDVADGAAMMHKGASKMIKGMKESCDTCKKKKFMNAGIPGKPVAELPPEEDEEDLEEPEDEVDPTLDDADADDVESSEDEAPEAPEAPMPMISKKKPMFQKKGMKKEDAEFMNSMKSHGGMFWKVDEYGNWIAREDAVIPPSDPNTNLQEPVAGEVGFAPQQKLGTNFTESKKPEKNKKHVSWF